MKTIITLIALSFLMSTFVQAKIVVKNNTFFVESQESKSPISLMNSLAKNKEISEVKLFLNENINMVAFAKKDEKEKIYSVAEDGYIYSIAPFTNYQIKEIDSKGFIWFKEDSKNKYQINAKGFFIH